MLDKSKLSRRINNAINLRVDAPFSHIRDIYWEVRSAIDLDICSVVYLELRKNITIEKQ